MTKSSHIAVFTFPFGSHPQALLNNTQRMAASAPPGVIFSFFNTSISNAKIFSGTPNSTGNLKVYNVWDGVSVSEGDDFYPKSPLEAIKLFLKATPLNFKKGVHEAEAETGVKVSCLLSDAFFWFSGEIAEEMGVPWAAFWIAGACSLSAHLHTDLIRSNILTGTNGTSTDAEATLKFLPGLSEIHISDLPEELVHGDLESPFAKMLHQMGQKLGGATAVVLNTFEELEPTVTNHLRSILQNVLCIGPSTLTTIPPPLSSTLPEDEDESGSCLLWLDKHKVHPKSVAYIGFGTVPVLPPSEVQALAEALECRKIPFLWSLRDSAKKLLPNGFLEKTSSIGKLVSWAPQLKVLAHPCVGVCVTHCGFNSVMESILSNVPVICRPLHGDNPMNCRLVEDVWKIGVKVEGGKFTKSGMMNALDIVMSSEKGEQMRENVGILRGQLLQTVGPDGSSTQNFKSFTDLIINT